MLLWISRFVNKSFDTLIPLNSHVGKGIGRGNREELLLMCMWLFPKDANRFIRRIPTTSEQWHRECNFLLCADSTYHILPSIHSRHLGLVQVQGHLDLYPLKNRRKALGASYRLHEKWRMIFHLILSSNELVPTWTKFKVSSRTTQSVESCCFTNGGSEDNNGFIRVIIITGWPDYYQHQLASTWSSISTRTCGSEWC